MKQLKTSDQASNSDLNGVEGSSANDDIAGNSLKSEFITAVPDQKPDLFKGLSPVRCFNYHTQLRVAGGLINESLADDETAVLIMDKNAETALEMLETFGFSLRQALVDGRLDIYYYRSGVRNRNFFKCDYQAILDAALGNRRDPVNHLVMIEFDTLFANSVKEALTCQLEDFCEVARSFDIALSGLYSPSSWFKSDFLSEQLPGFVGNRIVRQARADGESSAVEFSEVAADNHRS